MKFTTLWRVLMLALALKALSGCQAHLEKKRATGISKAKEISLDTFMIHWMERTVDLPNPNPSFNQVHKDSVFTYFVRRPGNARNYYKISNLSLARVDYRSINGDSIRRQFYDEIIPEKDRIKLSLKECRSSGSTSFHYQYKFIENEAAVEIYCKCRASCDFIVKLKETYAAKYDLRNKKFIDRVQ